MMLNIKTVDSETRTFLNGHALKAYEWLVSDPEVDALLAHANNVVVNRLHYNDHGSVHSRIVSLYSLQLADFLMKSGTEFNVLKEGIGSYADMQTVLLTASYLHDVGNAVMREDHEKLGTTLAKPLVDRLFLTLYPHELEKRIALSCMVLECIASHEWIMANSIEASIVKVADACDMTKGRSRIPLLLGKGDIHSYSAQAIEEVHVLPSNSKKVKIQVVMNQTAGVFQVQEQLDKKLSLSVLKDDVEVEVWLEENGKRRLLDAD